MTAALPLEQRIGAEAVEPVPDCCRRCAYWKQRHSAVGTCTNGSPIYAGMDLTRAGWTTSFAYVCPEFEAGGESARG